MVLEASLQIIQKHFPKMLYLWSHIRAQALQPKRNFRSSVSGFKINFLSNSNWLIKTGIDSTLSICCDTLVRYYNDNELSEIGVFFSLMTSVSKTVQ
jgi:hypothetical protein